MADTRAVVQMASTTTNAELAPYFVRSRRASGGSQIVSDVIRRADGVTMKTASYEIALKWAEALNMLAGKK